MPKLIGCLIAAKLTVVIGSLVYKFWSPRPSVPAEVTQLYIYPIKSCKGILVSSLTLTKEGIEHDRTFAVFDAKGEKMTIRDFPKMHHISVAMDVNNAALLVNAPGMPQLGVSLAAESAATEPVKIFDIWGIPRKCRTQGSEPSAWFSEFFGVEGAQLVRLVEPTLGGSGLPEGKPIALHDEAVALALSEESLQWLEGTQEGTMPDIVTRVRPNIVVRHPQGSKPFLEDLWVSVRIGDVTFDMTKTCERCSMPTVDPVTAEKHPRFEPTATLKRLRLSVGSLGKPGDKAGAQFGVHVHNTSDGTVRVGDALTVVTARRESPLECIVK